MEKVWMELSTTERDLLQVGLRYRITDCLQHIALNNPKTKEYWENEMAEAKALDARLTEIWQNEVGIAKAA